MSPENTSDHVKRGERGRWKKGASPNPGGRPRETAHVRELAREHTASAVAALVEVMEHSDKDSARVAAAVALLDRGWGRAPAAIEVTAGPSLEQQIKAMTPAERQKRLDELEVKALSRMSEAGRAAWLRNAEAKVRAAALDGEKH